MISKRDYLGLGSLVTALVVSGLVLMTRRSMWLDEIFSYVIITRPTFAAMWDSATGFIGTVPLYYIVAWVWTKVGGSSETMLRFLAMPFMSGSLILVYVRLRRHFETIPVFFGVGSAFLISNLVVLHNVEVRFYALFLFIACVFFYLFDWLALPGAAWPRFTVCFALTFAWTFEHLFALYYSAAVLAAMIIVHLDRRNLRPTIYGAFPLAWLCVAVAWRQPFNLQNHVYATIGFDAAPPDVQDLLMVMGTLVNAAFLSIVLLVGAMLLLSLTNKNERLDEMPEGTGHIGLFAVAVGFLLVPIGAWLMTRLVVPVFAPRYFIPSVIAYAVIFTYLVDRLLKPRLKTLRPVKIAIMACYASVILTLPILTSIIKQKDNLSFAADAKFYPNLPVIMEDFHGFVARAFYAGDSNRYRYIVDREAMAAPGNLRSAATDWAFAQTLAETMPARFALITTDELPNEFVVIHDTRIRWLDYRLSANRDYALTFIGTLSGSDNGTRWVYHVKTTEQHRAR